MAVATLRPSSTVTSGSNWSVGGAIDVLQAISDASDSSYGRHAPTDATSPYTQKREVALTNFAWPTGAVITDVQMFVRWRNNNNGLSGGQNTGGTSRIRVNGTEVFTEEVKRSPSNMVNGTIYQDSGPKRTTQPDGSNWTSAAVDSLQFMFYASIGTANNSMWIDFLDVWASATYLRVPNAPAVTVPTVAKEKATVTWVHSAPDGNAQSQWAAKLFRSSVVNGGAFNPDTSPAVGSTGFFNASSSVTFSDLADGRYYAYVRTAGVGNSNLGAWGGSAEFRVVNDPLMVL